MELLILKIFFWISCIATIMRFILVFFSEDYPRSIEMERWQDALNGLLSLFTIWALYTVLWG